MDHFVLVSQVFYLLPPTSLFFGYAFFLILFEYVVVQHYLNRKCTCSSGFIFLSSSLSFFFFQKQGLQCNGSFCTCFQVFHHSPSPPYPSLSFLYLYMCLCSMLNNGECMHRFALVFRYITSLPISILFFFIFGYLQCSILKLWIWITLHLFSDILLPFPLILNLFFFIFGYAVVQHYKIVWIYYFSSFNISSIIVYELNV